jgi:hypothetical protein
LTAAISTLARRWSHPADSNRRPTDYEKHVSMF